MGYHGSVHDTRVLKNSPVYLGACYPPPGLFIVGNGGYPCISQPVAIMTPFCKPVQGRVQERFSCHHARAQSIVEWAFGMMKTRWRSIFFKALEVSHLFTPVVIAVCAILHNVCLRAGDVLKSEGKRPRPGGGPSTTSSQRTEQWPSSVGHTGSTAVCSKCPTC